MTCPVCGAVVSRADRCGECGGDRSRAGYEVFRMLKRSPWTPRDQAILDRLKAAAAEHRAA